MFDLYTFSELAVLWARDTGQPSGAARRALARALIDNELTATFSPAVVQVYQNDAARTVDIYLKEDLVGRSVVGTTRYPLNSLPENILHQWMTFALESVQTGAERRDDPRLKLILIAQADFKRWLEQTGSPLPRFWFSTPRQPAAQNVALEPEGTKERRRTPVKHETKRLHDRWEKKAQEMLASDPGLTIREIAKSISNTKLSEGRTVETIRRVLTDMSIKRNKLS